MRYGLGLVGLLVAVALMMWMFATYNAPVVHEGKKAEEQAEQLSGRDETGKAATDAIKLVAEQRNGKVIGMRVTAIVIGSKLQQMYGLIVDDIILQAGDMPLIEPFASDHEMGSAMVLEAYKGSKPLTIQRGTQKMTLDPTALQVPGAIPNAPAPAAPTAAPAPSSPPRDPRSALQRQLDAIQNHGK